MVRDAERVRRSIGVVGQKPGFDPDATGRENLVMQAEIYGVRGTDRRARVDELLERRSRRGSRPVGEDLFRGMQRRLDVALGLVHRPRVLFLDEPTTGLDPARAELWREIERLASEEEMTILLTTHYLDEADRLASRLVIVDRGRVVVQGSGRAQERASGRHGSRRAGGVVGRRRCRLGYRRSQECHRAHDRGDGSAPA